MRDVAGGAGVSLQTVSNYVNGRFNLMSAETRERVGRELDRLGYWPNAAARSLRAKRTMTLGFLVLDEGARFLADPSGEAATAGLTAAETAALLAVDPGALRLAASSFRHKRTHSPAPRRRPWWRRAT